MKKIKRILVSLTVAAMTLLIAPEFVGNVLSQVSGLKQGIAVSVSAEGDIVDSGYCGRTDENNGENVTWTLDSNGVLTISGAGKMNNYDTLIAEAPWYTYCKYFASFKYITSVIINEGVTSIGDSTFEDFTSIASLTIPDSVTSIGSAAFYHCRSLASIIIPNSVASIGSYAFSGCSSLTSITIPNSVTLIEGYTFEECTNLTSIIIPNNVDKIGEGAFLGCTALTNVIMLDNITEIGGYAFRDCTSLTSIIIPDSVRYIRNGAFHSCTNLISIKMQDNDNTTLYDVPFANCINLSHIHIPEDKTYSYYAGKCGLPSEPSYYLSGGCEDEDCLLNVQERLADDLRNAEIQNNLTDTESQIEITTKAAQIFSEEQSATTEMYPENNSISITDKFKIPTNTIVIVVTGAAVVLLIVVGVKINNKKKQ